MTGPNRSPWAGISNPSGRWLNGRWRGVVDRLRIDIRASCSVVGMLRSTSTSSSRDGLSWVTGYGLDPTAC